MLVDCIHSDCVVWFQIGPKNWGFGSEGFCFLTHDGIVTTLVV